jgi:inhibitor of cysteine peptidase
MRQLDEHASGTEISLRTGDVVELRLQENPTTGYKWHFKAQGYPVYAVVAENYIAGGAAPGAGGTRHWQIRAIAAGTAQIELIHARHWETEAPPAQTFTMTIRAED